MPEEFLLLILKKAETRSKGRYEIKAPVQMPYIDPRLIER